MFEKGENLVIVNPELNMLVHRIVVFDGYMEVGANIVCKVYVHFLEGFITAEQRDLWHLSGRHVLTETT